MLDFIFSIWGLIVIALIGMIAHFAKKKAKKETATEVINYFKDHPWYTFFTFIVTVLATIAYQSTLGDGDKPNLELVFGFGYMIDSVINKWTGIEPAKDEAPVETK